MLIVSVMVVASAGVAKAESILFPYIANTTGNLDTIITVINTGSTATAPHLYYQYFTKAAGVANENVNPCNGYSFYRPTTTNDIVTFAVGGSTSLGGGNAMFNDATNYNAGSGAPNFAHGHGSGRFGYLVVSHYNAGIPGWVTLGNNRLLDGEASLYDIATGAMWGYRAVPNNPGSFAFFGSRSTLNVTLSPPDVPRISIYPPNQFTGRLFVTPVGSGGAGSINNMMIDDGKMANVTLAFDNGRPGVFDRNEATIDSGGPMNVRCVGRLNIVDLTGGALSPLSATGVLYNQGGWTYVDLAAMAAASGEGYAIVYDLKYGDVTGLSGMINDGKPVLDWTAR